MGNPFKRFWRRFWSPDSAQHHPVKVDALVVEDSPDEMDFICGLLRLQSVIVTQARSIAGALDAISGPTRFQIAFVDLNLPNGSGVEIVRRIKEGKRMTHCIVVSSALEKLPLVVEYGYIGILWKPYHLGDIRSILYYHRLPYND